MRQILDRVDPLPALYDMLLKYVDRRNTNSANSVLVNSEFTRDNVGCIYGIEAQVSYHGVDAEKFRPVPGAKRPIVLSVGSLTPLKGFDFLAEAVARISADKRPSLVIVSNFQNRMEEEFLKRKARKLGVDLQLLCNVEDDCLVELYSEAQVVAYAPIREPFGMVPLEAMACRASVVGVREGGIQETIVPGHTGLLVERDPAQFASAIQELLFDPNLATTFGRNGRECVLENWTWSRAVATLERHLVSVARTV